ncbi:MarR family winged helix-turn-helix transcriptional regulator [Hymenobacter sp. BT730]|uniref:MarR family winged helix-turn-helix transcriptional regulator n=1 Tax=Hymenobacter sp. BT730 TaxID=3063332 RepID=UPI0026E0FFD8|nr:MarR family transcriptional regulator [Hymenobacter sp. BT730]
MLNSVIFYSIDKAIRQYRKLAQANIDRARIAITVDQWLVLQVIREKDDLTQTEIAERIFKDQASVARIIRLLVNHGLLTAEAQPGDGRRTRLRVTAAGEQTLAAVEPIVLNNRQIALRGLSENDLTLLRNLLDRIAANCSTSSSH